MRRGSVDRVRFGFAGCGVAQYRVWHGSVEGCNVAQLRMQHGSVRVGPGSVRVRRGSAGGGVAQQGAAWLS